MIRISIITPSFNQSAWISRTIESVQTQDGAVIVPAGDTQTGAAGMASVRDGRIVNDRTTERQNNQNGVHGQDAHATHGRDARDTNYNDDDGTFELEHIVVDGGSTDGTIDILKSYGEKIRWVSEPDDGQADALNKGISLASGDIIGWLNSDDVYEPAALSSVVEIFQAKPSVQWIYGKVKIIDSHEREIRRWITSYKNRKMRKFSFSSLLAENWISQMGVFWRASAGCRAGEFRTDLHWCMDYDFWLRLAKENPGYFLDRYLAAFRWYPSSKSGAGFSKQFREEISVAIRAAEGKYSAAIFKHKINYAKIVSAYTIMQAVRNLLQGNNR